MLVKELVRKGHTVTIIASSFGHNVGTDEISAEGQMWKRKILDGFGPNVEYAAFRLFC